MSSEKREASPEASPLKGPAPKAVPEDTSDNAFEDGIPLNPMAERAIQFVPATPANGDAKVEIGDSSGATPTFVGLGKEELMKYANDPFWVNLRWFLFILFWVLWIAMLAGAIVIIVLAPRCPEKRVEGQTYLQVKASELAQKTGDDLKSLSDLGVSNVVVTEALQHQGTEPEAVTNFGSLHESVKDGLTSAIKKLRDNGIKVLLQIVPNHSGTEHEWYNDNATSRENYVWKPTEEVGQSVWVTQQGPMWTKDAKGRLDFSSDSFLSQFPKRDLADLNFRSDSIVDAFKQTIKAWREQFDGVSIGKASYLVEDLGQLMSLSALVNQPENVKIVSRMVGSSMEGANLVELNNPSNETIYEYLNKGLTPVIKSFDASSADNVVKGLEMINSNTRVVVDLTQSSSSPDKDNLVKMLVASIGSHSLISDEGKAGHDLLTKLRKFQKDNPRGEKSAEVSISKNENVVSVLRSDGHKHLIVANLGPTTAHHHGATGANKGSVVVSVSGASNAPQVNGTFAEHLELPALSGVIIKLDPQETSS